MEERTLIAVSIPNVITIGIIFFLDFLIVGVAWQLFSRARGQQSGPANNSDGY